MASIQGIYIALFGRPADPLGLQYFNAETNNGADLTAIGDLSASAEYQDRFEGQNNTQIVNSIYRSLFGRDADLAGLQYFIAELQSGRQTINTIAINILDGARGDDLAVVNNKIAAANAFTAQIDTGAEVAGYNGADAAEQGRLFLAPITSDEATIPTAEQTAAAVANAVNAGSQTGDVFTLTPGQDFADTSVAFRNGPIAPIESDFRFTANSERVSASSATLTAGDVLTDASNADKDTLNITSSGNLLGAIDGAVVTNIENINVSLTSASEAEWDMTNYTGVQSVVVAGSLAANAGNDDYIYIYDFAESGVTSFDVSGVATGVNAEDYIYVQDVDADQSITYKGHAGSDYVELGDGDNVIDLGTGTNEAYLGDGDNTVTGGALSDSIFVGSGDNVINAGDGVNEVETNGGDNEITTGSGADTISAFGGSNTIVSGAGVDTITVTGNGSNTITAGAGADIIDLSSTGDDTVILVAADTGLGAAADVISNFTTGSDEIEITDAMAATDANYYEFNLGGAAVADVLAAVNAEFNDPGFDDMYIFAYGDANGDGYLFVDSDLNGSADYSIKLLGLGAAADFARTDLA